MSKWRTKNYLENDYLTWFSDEDAKRIRGLISDYCANHGLSLFDDCPELVEIIRILE